jgi:hypothetical protein
MADTTNLTDNLKKLEEISQWFEAQDDLDVEQGLTKVKEAATLIKSSKARLTAIENEFQQIEREVADEDISEPINVESENSARTRTAPVQESGDEPINLDDIPF